MAKTKVLWTGEQDGDLGFLENEVVRVFNIVDDLWWQGSLLRNGAEGIFPRDFVEVISAPPSAQPSALATPTKARRTNFGVLANQAGLPYKAANKSTGNIASTPHHAVNYIKSNSLGNLTGKMAGYAVADPYDDYGHSASRKEYTQHVLSLAPSPKRSPKRASPEALPSFHLSLSQKKQELELQLHHLRQLEKLEKLEKYSGDSSFVSEDLLLSKRELGSKLDADEGPPVPKHRMQPSYDSFEPKLSLKLLQSDVLNLSELSATSAGSFMRHKYERYQDEQAELVSSVAKMAIAEEPDALDLIFKDKKSRHPRIFKMLMKKKPEENALEQRIQDDTWQTVKSALNRMNTLTSADKQARTRRAAHSEPNFIIKPLEYFSDINASETFGDGDAVETASNTRKVAEHLQRYSHTCDFNDVIADISVKFGAHKPDEIRAVLMHLCKFRVVEEPDRILQIKPKLHEVMAKGEATVFQINYLFKKLLEALRIPSEVVFGFWKKPNEFYHSDQLLVNHCWLSVMVDDAHGNGVFRMVDLVCFQNGSLCNISGFNEFYFLAEPTALVSTHIPSVIELQHVCPPIDVNVAFHLPRLYSGFNKNGLEFINFNNALTRMADLEFFETDIVVPPAVELFTLIKTSHITSYDYTLCQIYWKGSTRVAKIKAILPKDESIGVLQIFAGPKGLQTHFENIHELACVIPLYHSGTSLACKFVPRYPTIQSLNNDLYIKHPQVSRISVKNSYNFEVEAHPSLGLNSGSGIMNQDFKLVIESPTGKYTKLVKDDPHKSHGCYRSNINCQEPGVYRGLVIGDSGSSWYVFAQWECGA